jgi:hypothetical protein
MSVTQQARSGVTGWTVLLVGLRIVGAALLVAMAWIHYYLWNTDGYSTVHIIGPLFLINAIVGLLLAVVVLCTPGRLLGIVSGLSSLFMLGTLGALLLSLTVGLFGFDESSAAPLFTSTVWSESLGFVVLGVLSVLAFRLLGSVGPRRRS